MKIATTLIAVAAGASYYGVATAAADTMAALYTNTLHETRADGSQSWFMFDADHTFNMHNSDGKTVMGKWSVNDKGEMCVEFAGRAPPPCMKFNVQKVGDSWDRQGPRGNEHFVLEAGRKQGDPSK